MVYSSMDKAQEVHPTLAELIQQKYDIIQRMKDVEACKILGITMEDLDYEWEMIQEKMDHLFDEN